MSGSSGAGRIPGTFEAGTPSATLQTFRPSGVVIDSAGVAATLQALVYGPAIAIDAGDGLLARVTLTNNVAHTYGAPTGGVIGQVLVLNVRNGSGGAAGAATFNAAFRLAGAWVQPANNNQRSIAFFFDGATWVELSRNAADVPF